MSDIRRPLRCGLIALALCAASSAFAGIEVGGGVGGTVGGGTIDDHDSLILDFEAGYRFDNNFALHAVYIDEANEHDLCMLECSDLYHFQQFYAVKGVGYMPLSHGFELLGGAGFGRSTSHNEHVDSPDLHDNEGLLSVGAQWRATQAFRVVLEYDYLTSTSLQMMTARVHWEF